MATLEGKWDCKQCRTIGIAGLTTRCPNCGDARNEHLDPEEAPYLPADARVITSESELAVAASGPGWSCGKCGNYNQGDSEKCSNCSDPRNHDDRVNAVYTYVEGIDAAGQTISAPGQIETDWVDTTLQSADKLQQLEDGPVVSPARTFALSALPRIGALAVRDKLRASSQVSKSRIGIGVTPLLGVVAAVVMIIGGYAGYANFIKASEVVLTVDALEWERQVEIEEFRTLTQEDWTYPGDARVQRSFQAVHHYDRVLDHYEDRTRQVPETKQTGTRPESYACGSTTVNNGNGTFSSRTTYCTRSVPVYTTTYRTEHYKEPIYKQVPVYKTKYVFEIDRWVTDRFIRASAEAKPFWPQPVGLTGKQRVGNERKESYEVTLVDPQGREFDREVDLTTWSYLSEGETVPAMQTRRGSVRSVTWPTS